MKFRATMRFSTPNTVHINEYEFVIAGVKDNKAWKEAIRLIADNHIHLFEDELIKLERVE